ncbi:Sialic acid-binding periplasmic protein SiaP precursor [Pelagimonas phthalicica]|uniref:Sialic acid-binding periplasmic protein SiaP n=1 Tax=Pelagimonas phthalicica TaxID=1037362 RepID=A0A238JG96_9RHOB|nr:TRAP transporter substrate-binding protein [Pelagimonas phthalicica]TDS92384.1 TRAP-type C4-dicarboxylate transport system substrate-binding protein [Pelagimonas phthalicica]SMX29445.1 Sialic acid-binding periplasmic protein SiaP precursor [Pelagimonas phthalicica]
MTQVRRTFLKSVALAAITTGALATSAFAADVTLRLHQFLPAQANVPKNILDVWADKIEAESDGRIEIQRFPAMQLGGKPPELFDQVVDGVADITWTVAGYTPGRFPRAEVFELPFTMTNAEAVSKAYWELAEESMMDQDFKQVKVLGLWVHGPGLIHSKEPITSVSDLNGVKLRAPTRVTNKMFSNLGATPVGMPVPAVPEALSKGVIDATVIPWEVTGALKVNEMVGNHTTFGDDTLYTTTFVFAMNKDRYNALPDDLKAVIDANSGLEFSGFAGKQMQMDDAGPAKAAMERGNNIITLNADQVAEWKAAAEATTADWVAEMDEKGLDGTALKARAAELIAKHSQ